MGVPFTCFYNLLVILFPDLGGQGESVTKMDTRIFNCPSTSGQITTELHTVR